MHTIIIVRNPHEWKFNIPEVSVVSDWSYLTDPYYSGIKGIRVFNLCRSYRYQSYGYYVSLLAAARGHKPIPSVTTIQDMKTQSIVRIVSEELDSLIQKKLSPLHSQKFILSIYFGRNIVKHYDKLCSQLYKLFEAPFLRAYFIKSGQTWQLQNIRPIASSEIPEEHIGFIAEAAQQLFSSKRLTVPKRSIARYNLAILYNPDEKFPPSDKKAIDKFVRAARSVGFETEIITKDDYNRIAEFDALFIRKTTSVNHHTYRFARRAEAEGLIVIDDPQSILRCTNKVYLAELLEKHKIPTPHTMIVHKGNVRSVPQQLTYPLILKQPDNSFSQGVTKADNRKEYQESIDKLFNESMLLIAQEFMPTAFDWRVGILDHQALYVCKYYMAPKHWQVVKNDVLSGKIHEGKWETLPIDSAPRNVVRLALRAAKLMGDGFYGVDIKQIGGKPYIIEINDNPSIEAGVEDAVLKDELYVRIMKVFLKRIELLKERRY